MLENIKSVYILRHIFSNVIEKKILLLIIHNKRIQSKLNKSLIYYRIFSRKYIVYESLSKAKVYDAISDSLIFEGEYSNGKRNGKGIEYYNNGKKKFEGEYLNGKRHGRGKEYDYNGDTKFEGEYLNGKRWKAKLDIYGNKRQKIGELEYVNGKIWNLVEYDYNNKIISEIKEGRGYRKFFFGDRISIEGKYLDGKKHGIFKQYDYKGHLKHEFEYVFDKLWNAKKYDEDNNIITNILINGKGFMEEYEYGHDIFYKKFEGEYLNGERNGKGKEYIYNNFEGKLIFEGEYLNGERNGKGKEYNYDGKLIFEGEYLNGKRHGKGKEYYKYGVISFEG